MSRYRSRAVALVRASHPEPTLVVTVLTAVLAVDAGLAAHRVLLVTAAVFTGQLSIGWSNDVLDVGRDRMVQRPDKPIATGAVPERVVRLATTIALLLCIVLSLLCGWASGLTHLVLGVGSGWAYNLVLKRTWMSWLPYALAFGSLPAVIWLADQPPRLPPGWVMGAGALLGIGAHLVNALPDLDDDLRTGVVGLPQRAGSRGSRLLAAAALVGASIVAFVGPGTRPPWWCWLGLALVGLLAVVTVRSSGRLAFQAALLIAVLDVVLLTAR